MPTSARLRVSFGVPICLYGSLFYPDCILSFLYYDLELIFDADNPYPLPHPHLRGSPYGARGPDRHPGGLSGERPRGGPELCLRRPAGLLRGDPGGRGERGHVEGLQGAEQGVHRPDHRCGAGAGLQEPQAAHRRHRGGAGGGGGAGPLPPQRAALPDQPQPGGRRVRPPEVPLSGSPQPGGEEQHHPPLPGGGRPAEGHA